MYERVRQYVCVVLNLLMTSFPFDCLYTDIPEIKHLSLPFPVIIDDTVLIKMEGVLPHQRLQHAILERHTYIPLRLCDWRTFDHIRLVGPNTSFRAGVLEQHRNILLLTGTNPFYAGFLSREFHSMGYEEVLPVSLFSVNRR